MSQNGTIITKWSFTLQAPRLFRRRVFSLLIHDKFRFLKSKCSVSGYSRLSLVYMIIDLLRKLHALGEKSEDKIIK